MKELLRKITPNKVIDIKNNLSQTYQMKKSIKNDNKRFTRYSFDQGKPTYSQIEARLTKAYHSIEKGLSYSNIRLGFGKDVLRSVTDLMFQYRELGFPLENHVYKTALSNLHKYIELHKKNKYDVKKLEKIFDELKEGTSYDNTGGVYYKTKEEILNATKMDFKNFSLNRHSIRDYSEEPVCDDLIKQSLKLASHTPSACNRQPWKVRVVETPELKKIVQKNQNGNRGFGDYIDKFLIVTSDVQYYDGSRERNQANIDGGMYAMNLIYALHYYEIATIPLSGSLTIKQENNLRKEFDILDSENFIMFIGIGNYTDHFKIAKSDRREPTFIKY